MYHQSNTNQINNLASDALPFANLNWLICQRRLALARSFLKNILDERFTGLV